MSIAAKYLTVLTLIAAPADAPAADHAPFYAPGTKEYQANLTHYSQEMITATYAERMCKPVFPKIHRNEAYFDYWSPMLFETPEENDKMVRPIMEEQRKKLDVQLKKLGPNTFCVFLVKFLEESSASHGPSILTE